MRPQGEPDEMVRAMNELTEKEITILLGLVNNAADTIFRGIPFARPDQLADIPEAMSNLAVLRIKLMEAL